MRETVKELAQLDGGFVVGEDGTVVSAARLFEADTQDAAELFCTPQIQLPRIYAGGRHPFGCDP